MNLLLFGGPSPSLANRFCLRRRQVLFHRDCCKLRTFATETAGKLASVICVDVGVVTEPVKRMRTRPLLTNGSLFSVSTWISSRSTPEAEAPSGVYKILPSRIENSFPVKSVLILTARTWAFAKLHVTHSKEETCPCEEFRSLDNLFVLNNMAERVGFEPTLEFPLNTLSKRAPSATRPSLRVS